MNPTSAYNLPWITRVGITASKKLMLTCIMFRKPRSDPLGMLQEFIGTVLNACCLNEIQ